MTASSARLGQLQLKPLSHQQRCFVQKHRCFLLRNYDRAKRSTGTRPLRDRQVQCGNADLLVAQGGKKQLTPQLQHQQAGDRKSVV